MELIDQAAAELGTRRTTDTVHEALRDVVARAHRARLAQRDFEDLAPDVVDHRMERALWVYEQLSAPGRALQRAVKHPDLLIAAAAEAADVRLLHYYDDYDLIADITGQPMRWLAPKGSLR